MLNLQPFGDSLLQIGNDFSYGMSLQNLVRISSGLLVLI